MVYCDSRYIYTVNSFISYLLLICFFMIIIIIIIIIIVVVVVVVVVIITVIIITFQTANPNWEGLMPKTRRAQQGRQHSICIRQWRVWETSFSPDGTGEVVANW